MWDPKEGREGERRGHTHTFSMLASEAPTCRKMACNVLTKAAASSGDLLSRHIELYEHKRRLQRKKEAESHNVPHVGFRDDLDEGGSRSVQVDEGAASVR